MHYLGTVSKTTAWSWFISEANHSNIIVIQVYAPTTNAKKAEVKQFYEDLEDLLELIPKRCPFHHRELEGKSRKSRDTRNNRHVWPWSTKWTRAKANRVFSREHTGYRQHPLPQHKRLHYTQTSPNCQYQNKPDYVFCSQRWRNFMQSAKTRPAADSGSNHELLIENWG